MIERKIVVCDDHYAAVKDGSVVGVVCKCNDTQWGFYPLGGGGGGGMQFIPVHHALEEAYKFLESIGTAGVQR